MQIQCSLTQDNLPNLDTHTIWSVFIHMTLIYTCWAITNHSCYHNQAIFIAVAPTADCICCAPCLRTEEMLYMQILFLQLHWAVNYMAQMHYFILFYFIFLRQGFSVALVPVLELALVDQAGFILTEICLPLPLKCLD